jgi:hypothetical protein
MDEQLALGHLSLGAECKAMALRPSLDYMDFQGRIGRIGRHHSDNQRATCCFLCHNTDRTIDSVRKMVHTWMMALWIES